MPFISLGAVSYSPSIVTMTVSVAVCEIFSVKEWCDLENRVRVRRGVYPPTVNEAFSPLSSPLPPTTNSQ